MTSPASGPTVLVRVATTHQLLTPEPSHGPILLASLGGRERRFVLDTGSDIHLLTYDLANELRLEMRPGEEGTDHAGNKVQSMTVGDLPLPLGELQITLRNVFAIEAPPPFRERGIDGILSPQLLHESAVAVVDMTRDELLLVDGTDEQVADFLHGRSPALQPLMLRREPDFPSLVVRGTIKGFAETTALIDTGGKKTEFSSDIVHGLLDPASAERLGGGVGGGGYSGGMVGPQVLVVGGVAMSVPDLAVREGMDVPKAIIGMDVIAGSVIAAAADVSRPCWWLVPPPGEGIGQ
jgi:hypothetical protein